MFSPLALFLSAQIIFIMVLSGVGLLAARRHARTLQQEIEAGDTSLEAYLRFATARRSMVYPVRLTTPALTIVIICMVFISILSSAFTSSIPDLLSFFFQFNVLFPLFLAFLIGHIIGSYVYSLLRTMLIDAEAVRVFQISALLRREIATLKIRQALLQTLPLVLFMEVSAMLLIFFTYGNLFDVLFLLLSLCTGGAAVIDAVFDAPLFAFMNALQPIARTPWAALAPRIAAWAQLAGVEFSSVQIQQDMLDAFGISISGLSKPMLIISEFFLRHSEWRQQDAMISVAIGMVKKRITLHALVSRLATWTMLCAFFLLLLFTNILPPIISLLSIFLLFIGLFVAFSVMGSYSQRLQARNYTEAFRMASFLTGDPVAVRVALSVTSALDGVTVEQIQQDEQVRKLDELAQQSWPRAPQAGLPVPAVYPVSFGPYSLTTPLNQAAAPGPVPTTPYGTVG